MKKQKDTDCYQMFEKEIQFIREECETLRTLLTTPRSCSYPHELFRMKAREKESLSYANELLQSTLTSFVTPLERKDIIRFMHALTTLLKALYHTSLGLSGCPDSKCFMEFQIYAAPLSQCCSQLEKLVQNLPDKKQLPLFLSWNRSLRESACAARFSHIDCLQNLYRSAVDFRQFQNRYHIHRCFLHIFTCFEDCCEILEEIVCGL